MQGGHLRRLYFNRKIQRLPYECIYGCDNLRSVVFASGTKLKSGSSAIADCEHLAVIVGTKSYIFRWMAEKAGATLITL